jgi:TRAP-type mannitol/chloroaromatic compound transport system substrate-binding protein
MQLTDREKEMLDGKDGEAVRIAMSILSDIGDAVGAEEMTEIVQLKEYSSEMLQKFRQISDKILQGQASKDSLTQEVLNSIWRFQKEASGWSMVSLQSFLNARNKV